MNEINRWFKEGKWAAIQHEIDCESGMEEFFPECPWPIYSPEGSAWLRGWNSAVPDSRYLRARPQNRGWLFEPDWDACLSS